MANAILRNLKLLQAIPRYPVTRDVASLHRTLENAGYRITRRQVQRDLDHLSGTFPISADVEQRGYARGWSWDRSAEILDLPGMDPRTALMLQILAKFAPQLLPPAVADELKPYFRRAAETLKNGKNTGLAHWSDCVRVVPREMPLLPPKVDGDTARVAYDALLQGKRFNARYTSRSAGGKEHENAELNPLGLVVRGNLVYLVCTFWDYEDVRQIPIHRIRDAKLLEKDATHPKGFDLDQYIANGALQYLDGDVTGKTITLKVIFDRAVAAHLAETPLSSDQTMKNLSDDEVLVTASVRDTQQLEWWLRAFGEAAEVMAPKALRDRMKTTLIRAAARYRHRARRD